MGKQLKKVKYGLVIGSGFIFLCVVVVLFLERKVPQVSENDGDQRSILSKPSTQESQATFNIPPVPPDSGPVLRADQLAQQTRHNAVSKLPAKNDATDNGVSGVAGIKKEGAFETEQFADDRLNRPVKVVARELLVRFSKGCSEEERDSLLSKYGATLLRDNDSSLQKLGYLKIRIADDAILEDVALGLGKNPLVSSVEPNAIVRSFGEEPSTVSLDDQWGLQAIRALEAWAQTQGDPDIVIAVVDSGIDLDHPNLVNCIEGGVNLIDADLSPDDDYGHGTQVAGIIVANPVTGMEISGVAPKCKVMPFKVIDAIGEGACADVAEAVIMAVDQGCRIINLSLGTYFQSELLKAAVEYAANNNCVVIAAGGNDGSEEACYPAAYTQTIGVSAIGQGAEASRFSNRAYYIDVTAPGECIQTTTLNGAYESVDGTSASAAHVSGMAALLLSLDDNLSQDILSAIIRNSAQDLSSLGWDNSTGMGLIDCVIALSSPDASVADIGIVDLTVLPNSPLPGQTAHIYVTVRNHGTETFEPRTVLLRCGDTTVARGIVPVMLPKTVSEMMLSWPLPSNSTPGSISLVTEIESLPLETRILDNIYETAVNIASNAVFDVAILGTRVNGIPFELGATVGVDVIIANIGNVTIPDAVLKCTGFERSITNALSLQPGERRTVRTQWVLPDDAPAPHEVSQAHPLIFRFDDISDSNSDNDRMTLFFGYRKEHNQVVPFHVTGDSYSDNEYVHQWIAKEAYDYFISQVQGADISSYLGSISGSFSVENNDLLEGTIAEDKAGRYPLNQSMPYLRHFCQHTSSHEDVDIFSQVKTNPLLPLNTYYSAYTQAANLLVNYAIPDYSSNKSRAYYCLGHVAHLLTDMAVPAHVNLDLHPADLGDADTYEALVIAYDEQFKWWYYNCSRSGDWNRIIPVSESRSDLFYRVARYTADYDSHGVLFGADGIVNSGGSAYDPDDYPATWHKPSQVDRSGGFTSSEVTIICDDLMPYAIQRVAELYRYWYKQVDSTDPISTMTYPSSESSSSPDYRSSTSSFNLTASASDSKSGILKNGYQFRWNYHNGSGWSGWSDVTPSPTDSSVSFTQAPGDGLYAFHVWSENGGGRLGDSNIKYLRIDSTPPSVDMTYPSSEDVGNPTLRTSLSSFNLTGSASDLQSGVQPNSYQFSWAYWEGSDWSAWSDVLPSPTGSSVTFTPSRGAGWYYFDVSAENGAGARAWSNVKYLWIQVTTKIISLSGDMAFGDVTVGSTATRTLTISNTGNSTLNVSSIDYPTGFSGDWSGGGISSGNTKVVNVTFAPTDAIGYGGTITVNSDKTSGTNTRPCSGTGTAVPTRIIEMAGDLSFGDVTVGSTATRTLTISNTGNSTLNVSSIDYPTGFSGDWSGGGISSGNTKVVNVTFAPTDAIGYGGTITVNSDKTSGTNTRPCSGAGVQAGTPIHYVNVSNATPVVPYSSWATAATDIQDAVDVASSNDTVLVTNGTYYLTSQIVVDKDIRIKSVNGHDYTIVDGGGITRCFNLGANSCIVSGLTITNGYVNYGIDGAGIFCSNLSPIATNCYITGNCAGGSGSGMIKGTAYNCSFVGNGSDGYGGGGMASGVAHNCIFQGNKAGYEGGGMLGGEAYNCLFLRNDSWEGMGGGAMSLGATAYNCTFYDNVGGGGGAIYNGTAYNCVFLDNRSQYFSDRNDIWGAAYNSCSESLIHGVNGNITNAPLFIDAIAGDYRLMSNSPCINWGNSIYTNGLVDLDGSNRVVEAHVDIGCYEYQGVLGLSDSDNDGLPDDWEHLHFGGNADPNRDDDLDGQKNWEERISGMNPMLSSSVFAVTNFIQLPTGEHTIMWPSVVDRFYFVYWTDDLWAGFQPIKINIEYPMNWFLDDIHGTNSQGFYQLVVDTRPHRFIESLSISGPVDVPERSSAQYICTGYDIVLSSNITLHPKWSVDSDNATIDSSGLLTIGELTDEYGYEETVTIEAIEYSDAIQDFKTNFLPVRMYDIDATSW